MLILWANIFLGVRDMVKHLKFILSIINLFNKILSYAMCIWYFTKRKETVDVKFIY